MIDKDGIEVVGERTSHARNLSSNFILDEAILRQLTEADTKVFFGVEVPLATVDELLTNNRTRDRACALVENRFGRLPENVDQDVVKLCTCQQDVRFRITQQVGAVWHSRLFTQLVDGESLRALIAVVGEPCFVAAKRWGDLAPSREMETVAPDRFVDLIIDAGRSLLGSWRDHKPEPVRRRLELLLPGGEHVGPENLSAAHRVVNAVLLHE